MTKAFQEISNETKPNNVSVDKASKFYNRSLKSWLQGNNIEMYSTHN